MPLPLSSTPRQLKHTRQITIEGYVRDDGLWDIEARLTDRKPRELKLANGTQRPIGEALHDMTLRLTIDTQMNVVDAIAVNDAGPYPGHCETITPAYRQLIGLNLFRQFRQEVRARVGDIAGCTHITEMAALLPTAALQSLVGVVFPFNNEKRADAASGVEPKAEQKPFQLDKCHALRTDGEAVRLYYPKWYRADFKES